MSLVEEHGRHKFTRSILRQRKASNVVSLHEYKLIKLFHGTRKVTVDTLFVYLAATKITLKISHYFCSPRDEKTDDGNFPNCLLTRVQGK